MEDETLVTAFRQFIAIVKKWILSLIGANQTPTDPVDPEPPIDPPVAPPVVDPPVVNPPVVVPPVVVLPKCPEGPVIKKVTIINDRLIDVLFHGRDVFWARIIVKNPEGNVINDTAKFENHSNTPRITLSEPLRDGEYTIIYDATSCSGTDSKMFNGRTGAFIEPGMPQPSPCPDPVKITNINIS